MTKGMGSAPERAPGIAAGLAAGLLLGIGFLIAPAPAGAVSTKTWKVSGREAFMAADLESLSVTSDGVVSLAPAFDEIQGIDPAYVWCLAWRDGTLWAGSGNNGELFAVSGGKGRLVHDTVALEIESLAFGKDGTVYLGTAPDATILAVGADGKARTFVDLPDRHVWAMIMESSGHLLAATGDRARLYRIDPAGSPALVHEGSGDHFTSMALHGEEILLGADQEGLLFGVRNGRARVIMDAAEAEVKSLVVLQDGTIYGAVNPPIGGSPEGQGPKPVVYRVRADGVVEPVWTSPEPTVQALVAEPGGALLAATGGAEKGSIYRIETLEGRWALLGRPGPPQILSLTLNGGELWAGSGSPGKIYRASLSGAPKGTLLSTVHDARQVADWGVLRWDTVEGSESRSLTFRTRTGNSSRPDETWSDWSSELTAAEGSRIESPAGRFIQWEATFAKDAGGSPLLRSVTVAYLEKNLSPVIHSLDVSPPGVVLGRGGDSSGPQPVVQTLPGNVRAEFSMTSPGSRGPATDEEAAWARRYRTLKWEAVDPNEDPLVYRVKYRGRGESEWHQLKEDLKDPVFVFDSGQISDGLYRFRVEASDALKNPPGESRTANRESDFVTVDNTPPRIERLTARRDGSTLIVEATLVDDVSPLKMAELSVNGKDWVLIHPVDRVFDQLSETIAASLDPKQEGEVTVLLRAVDQAGNIGVARASAR